MKRKIIIGVIVGLIGVVGTVGAITGYAYISKPDIKIDDTNVSDDIKPLSDEKIDIDLNYDDIVYKDGKMYFKKYVVMLGQGDYPITVNDKDELVCRGGIVGNGVKIADKQFGDLSSVEVVDNDGIYKDYKLEITFDPFIIKEITFEIKDGKENITEEKDVSFKDFKNKENNFNKVRSEYDVQQRIRKVMRGFDGGAISMSIMRVHDSEGKYTFAKFYGDEARTAFAGFGILNDETGEVYTNDFGGGSNNIVDVVLLNGNFYGILTSGDVSLLNLDNWKITQDKKYENRAKALGTQGRYLGTSGDYIYLKYTNGNSESLVSFNTKTGEFSKAYKGENNNLHIQDMNNGYIIFTDGTKEDSKNLEIGRLNGNTIDIIQKNIESLNKGQAIVNDEYIAVEKTKFKEGTKNVEETDIELYKLK